MAGVTYPMTQEVLTRDKLMADLAAQIKLNCEGQAVLADLLKKLDRRLNPSREFYPILITLAAGATYTHQPGFEPVAWFVSLDPSSTTGAIAVPMTHGGPAWINLVPGAHVVFPARSQSLTVTNAGSGNANVTLAALGDVPFEYATT